MGGMIWCRLSIFLGLTENPKDLAGESFYVSMLKSCSPGFKETAQDLGETVALRLSERFVSDVLCGHLCLQWHVDKLHLRVDPSKMPVAPNFSKILWSETGLPHTSWCWMLTKQVFFTCCILSDFWLKGSRGSPQDSKFCRLFDAIHMLIQGLRGWIVKQRWSVSWPDSQVYPLYSYQRLLTSLTLMICLFGH